MWLKSLSFLSLVFAALALAPAMAHLLELPNKINLSRAEYLTVQQIYRGSHNWTMLPEKWEDLRRQWEYSHATSAVLNLVALVTLILSVLATVTERQH